ncbi:hypothetical protein ACOMHN_036090 [Nucella lapillus]
MAVEKNSQNGELRFRTPRLMALGQLNNERTVGATPLKITMATKLLLLTLFLVLVTLTGSAAGDRYCTVLRHVCAPKSGYGPRCRGVCQVRVNGGRLKCMCIRSGGGYYARRRGVPPAKPPPPREPINWENQFEWMIKWQRVMNRY